jgi:hypothetical protein
LPGVQGPLHALRHDADAKNRQTGADHAAPQAAFRPQHRFHHRFCRPLFFFRRIDRAGAKFAASAPSKARADFSAAIFSASAGHRNRYAVLTVRSSQFISDQKFQRRIEANMRQRIDVHHLRTKFSN